MGGNQSWFKEMLRAVEKDCLILATLFNSNLFARPIVNQDLGSFLLGLFLSMLKPPRMPPSVSHFSTSLSATGLSWNQFKPMSVWPNQWFFLLFSEVCLSFQTLAHILTLLSYLKKMTKFVLPYLTSNTALKFDIRGREKWAFRQIMGQLWTNFKHCSLARPYRS